MTISTVVKQPSESRLHNMDFAPLLADSETLETVVSAVVEPTTLSPLVLSAPAVSGTVAQFRLTGGLDGVRYKVTVVVTSSENNTLEGEGLVQVEDL